MTLDDLLNKPILGDNPAREVQEFLYAHLPTFTAPTDAKTWRRQVPRLQRQMLQRVFFRGIPAKVINARPRVVWGDVHRPDPAYVVRKLRYEIYPDYWIPALLYEPTNLRGAVKIPVVLNPNGHGRGGKAMDYKQARCINLAKRGMLALNIEFIGMSELESDCHHNNIGHVDMTGMAGVGLFYLPLKKGLDVLLAHKHADPSRVCVTGLSGGGWQTIVVSALDPRVTVCVPVAGYTAQRARVGCPPDLGDNEQTPVDMAAVADYDTLTAMLAPRPTLLICNEKDDCCFRSDRVRPVIYEAVKPTYAAFGAPDNLQFHSNLDPGTHNYLADNRSQLYKFLNKHFQLPPGTPEHDIHRAEEIYTEDELRVGLPPRQATVLGIARDRVIALNAKRPALTTAAQKRQLRKKLAACLNLPRYEAQARRIEAGDGAENLALKMGPWTAPTTWSAGAAGEPAVLVMTDAGRAGPIPLPIKEPGPRCYTEVFRTGETRKEVMLGMLINATGQRVLGIQAAQALAAARYAAQRAGAAKVHAVADGYTASFVLMMAAALEPGLFESLTPYSPVTSLLYVIDWPLRYEEAQSMLCPGLLELADVPQLRALMEGVEYRQTGRDVVPDRR